MSDQLDDEPDPNAAEPEPGEDVRTDADPDAEVGPDLDHDTLTAALEAVLFVQDAPVTITVLATALRQPVPAVEQALEQLGAGYDARAAGIELRAVAGGVRLYTRSSVAGYVEQFLRDGQRSRLSQAALETLAVVAYRQPVTRARVSAIRGVTVDGVVRTLATRGLVVEAGADPETGGGLLRTTELFLERMGLDSLDELPSLAPLLPELDGLEYDEL